MRYPRDHKQQTREQILDQAARAFRSEGVAEVSIGALMRGLGLTHGGFYAHFPSKDALVAEACARALAEAADRLFPLDDDNDRQARVTDAIRRYLSRSHRDAPATGCLLPALAGEIAHEPAAVRHGFTEALRGYVERIATVMAGGGRQESGASGTGALRDGEPARVAPLDPAAVDRALVLVAGMAGAVLLARAVDDTEISDRLLLAARRFYTETFAKVPVESEQSEFRGDPSVG